MVDEEIIAEVTGPEGSRDTSARLEAPDPYVGKTIDGRYVVEAILGEGGMGVVYRGRHKVIDKKVAIKVLRGDMARNKEVTNRFLQEAKAASSIGNPHIIDISDFGMTPEGSTYFVMEFLSGQSLTDVIKQVRPFPLPRLLSIVKQIATGLAAAHAAGIVHRDLKPDNIMVVARSGPGTSSAGKDFVKILDFGIAKVGGEASRLTQAGSIFGTPHYMSPEQAAGTAVDHRTDIYALGIILYEMASGKVPFDADNFMGILTQHMYKAPVPILMLVPAPEIPPGLDAIIQKCLMKKSDARYASMEDLIADLEILERGEHPIALTEMMARSGPFSVPPDYFRASAMPAPVPATPPGVPGKQKGRLLFAIATVSTMAVGAIAVTMMRTGPATARGAEHVAPTIAVAASSPPVEAHPTIPPPPPATAAAPAAESVTLAVTPKSATVVKTGTTTNLNLHTSAPGMVELSVDAPTSLEISAPGYKTTTVKLDGKTPLVRIDLDPKPATPRAPSTPTKPKTPKKCNPGDDLCDPFG